MSRASLHPVRTPLGVTVTVAAVVAGLLAAAAPAQAAPAAAPGAPGALSHFDEARKDCVGTARNTTSKIWYTVADGVLSDVYAPTIDTTNVETMQYVVTDGSTFTDVQQRDTTYTVTPDASGMACTVVATAKSGAYRITTTYFTDPARPSVMTRVRYQALTPAARGYHLYVRLDATAGGNGGGGTGNGGADSALVDTSSGRAVPVSYDTVTTTNAANRDYARPTYVALAGDPAFGAVSSGFVGTDSDGLTQLDASHTLAPVTDTATGGNVEQTAAVGLDGNGRATLALAVADTQAGAVAAARSSSGGNAGRTLADYQRGWSAYDAQLRPPSYKLPGQDLTTSIDLARRYFRAANVIKASEDKTFPGAIVAGLASPWGQAVSAGDPANTYFGSYREVFARDLYETWSALYADGDQATAKDTVRFLFLRQQEPDGSMPRNSLVNGALAPDSFNTQLDEVAYPILMALQSGLDRDTTLYPHIQAAANYLIAHGPSAGPERWEEQSGYSPSTIAAEIAGLVAAGTIAARHGDAAASRVYLATADTYQRSIKGWTVTTTGALSDQPYFIRLSKSGDPNAAISYDLGNGGPTLDQRAVVDAGFLELVRLGELAPSDPDVVRSLGVVDATIERTTPTGPGWLRYNGDGYGDCVPDGRPAPACQVLGAPWAPSGKGTGHIWPVLASERGEYDLLSGDATTASSLAVTVAAQSSGVGLVPEQVWDAPDVPRSPFGSDPTTASIGFVDGKPDGSAAPLTWGVSSLVRLTRDLATGQAIEQPTQTVDRYVAHQQAATTLTVTSPEDRTNASGTLTVTGTTAPGAQVDVADVATDRGSATTVRSARAGADGSFSVPVPVAEGTNAVVITATAPDGGTASTVRTVVDDVVDGTLVYSRTDPTGDDNGPGTYQYPTAGDFHPGAYDMTDFQVYDTGSTVTFRVRTQDLTPTFGSPIGAQLLDFYIGQPGVAPTSTAASFPGRNYAVAPPWNRLIEAQGFGQRFVDATGVTLGTLAISGNQISRWITVVAPKSAFGGATPGAGWSFAITVAGQDGFSPDQARAFTTNPGPYSFGVCPAGGTAAICAVDPGTVPKVMDTFAPDGVSQADELDPTRGPVTVQGFTIP